MRIHAAPVFAPARIQENIPGELFMYWFRARGYVGVLFLENQGDEAPPHIKNWGSQTFMLGTPLFLYVDILYVGIPYVLCRPLA